MQVKTLAVDLGDRGYNIVVGCGVLEQIPVYLKPLKLSRRCLLVTNSTVDALYGDRVRRVLHEGGYDVATCCVEDSETAKSLDNASRLYDAALEHGLDRLSAVIALGGGVVGDLAGFVAATYMRGVPFIQLPTTLLAQVDSSVGGKVAVNHPLVKNIIGAFYQPRIVISDISTLKTLPLQELRAGLAEVIKYGVIWDRNFFTYLSKNVSSILSYDQEILQNIIVRSCEIKAEIVEADEKEEGLRMVLNYGHSFGHAVETLGNYEEFRHGEAVAIGMVAAARIAQHLGKISPSEVDMIRDLINSAGLPTVIPSDYSREKIINVLFYDKKNRGRKVTLVLPRKVGQVEIYRVKSISELTCAWEF